MLFNINSWIENSFTQNEYYRIYFLFDDKSILNYK